MSATHANVVEPVVDAAHFEAARAGSHASLQPAQVEALRAFAARHGA